ncbi:class I SAM-dependent methyltransferase [Myxococcota bacterium]|nr:class I SAM-dependent methyltransferase [Myxococcota bacterium]MBU1535796.1 class I SAM-dependent methyltransferase [Myxococcota bacterium]
MEKTDMINSKIWDFWSSKYEKLWVQKYSLRPTRREIISRLDYLLPAEGPVHILDMGCGTGQLVREIKAAFPGREIIVKGVDISQGMIRKAHLSDPQGSYEVYSMEGYHDERHRYDFITCTHSLPYYENQGRALEKFHSWLKPGGYLLLANASTNNLYDAFAMFFVKWTTSRAHYPSVVQTESLLSPFFFIKERQRIRERFYMSSIYLFVCQKGWKQER